MRICYWRLHSYIWHVCPRELGFLAFRYCWWTNCRLFLITLWIVLRSIIMCKEGNPEQVLPVSLFWLRTLILSLGSVLCRMELMRITNLLMVCYRINSWFLVWICLICWQVILLSMDISSSLKVTLERHLIHHAFTHL